MEFIFVGLWVFGWEKFFKGVYLVCIYLIVIGIMIFVVFIFVVNFWMQNFVGVSYNLVIYWVELIDFGVVLSNLVFKVIFVYQILFFYMVVGVFIVVIVFWYLVKVVRGCIIFQIFDVEEVESVCMWCWVLKFGVWVFIVVCVGVVLSGDYQGKVMIDVQFMKMVVVEVVYQNILDFLVLIIGNKDGLEEVWVFKIFGMFGFFGNGKWGLQVKGINEFKSYQVYEYIYYCKDGLQIFLQVFYQNVLCQKIDVNGIKFELNVLLFYWIFCIMIIFGMIGGFIGFVMFIVMCGGCNLKLYGWLIFFMIVLFLLLLFVIFFGWIFMEMGCQFWIVVGVLLIMVVVLFNVLVGSVFFLIIVYIVVYGILVVVEVGLFWKVFKEGLFEFFICD